MPIKRESPFLNKQLILSHLKEFSQYSPDPAWAKWYSRVAYYKGKRTVKLLLKYKKPDSRVLDLGCGIGLTLASLAQTFPDSVGADIGKKEVEASKKLLKKCGLKVPVVLYNGKRLPFKDHSFDIVASIEVIEHVKNPLLMLKEIKRVLKPDGILHITTANKWWPIEPHYKLPFLSYLPKRAASVYLKFTHRGASYHDINLPSYEEFSRMVSCNFIVEDVTLEVISEYKRYDFGKERGIKVILLGRFLRKLDSLKGMAGFTFIIRAIEAVLLNCSLGWLFIARPKNE